jgi:hypothetical protein
MGLGGAKNPFFSPPRYLGCFFVKIENPPLLTSRFICCFKASPKVARLMLKSRRAANGKGIKYIKIIHI